MTDWSGYKLTDIPFLANPQIKIKSEDIRTNGKLFYREPFEESMQKMERMILSDSFPWIFLRSEGTILGNGKSAFLAAVFHDLMRTRRNLVWATATSDPRMRDLLARILDALVDQGKIGVLRGKFSPFSYHTFKKVLAARGLTFGSTTTYAIGQMLSAEEYELTYVYANIKRRIPVQLHTDLFGDFLSLFYAMGESRFIIFIDQFEEYVRSHRTESQRENLAQELNDLQRSIGESTTVVVSTHAEAESILLSRAEIETFTRIGASSVDFPPWNEDDLVNMIKLYMESFRPKGYSGESLYPFDKDVVRYSVHRTDMIPRGLMQALRSGLIYGAFEKYARIDRRFVSRHHREMFGGYEDRWKDFKAGKFRYKIE